MGNLAIKIGETSVGQLFSWLGHYKYDSFSGIFLECQYEISIVLKEIFSVILISITEYTDPGCNALPANHFIDFLGFGFVIVVVLLC